MSLEQEQPQNELKQPEQPEQPEHKNPEPELENLENLEHKNLEHENPEYESSSTKATKTAKIYPDKQFKIVHVVYDSPFKVFNQVRNWFNENESIVPLKGVIYPKASIGPSHLYSGTVGVAFN